MRRFLLFCALIAVVAFGVFVATSRIDPQAVSAEQYWRMATQSKNGTFGSLPGVKKVVVRPLRRGVFYYVKYYAGLLVNRKAEAQAYYDPRKDTIFVVGDEACVEATLPDWMRPTFRHTLRHEYGHAMIADWLLACAPSKDGGGEQYLAYTESSELDPSACPAGLKAVAEEYRTLPQDVYGQPYYLQTFNEYMAESFARFVDGKYVPPTTRLFLAGVAKAGAAGQAGGS